MAHGGVHTKGSLDLKQLQKQLKLVQSPGFKRKLLKQLAVEGLNQVAISFDKEQDPYGNGWKPWAPGTAAKRRGGKILTDTARLRNSFRATSSAETFTISTRVAYAAIQNYGGKPKRRARQSVLGARAGRGVMHRPSGANLGRVGIPARPYLPAHGKLGTRWSKAFADISNAMIVQAMTTKAAPKAHGEGGHH